MTPDEHKTVPDRITRYLTSGGLFNPELACHEDVRGLLIDCRTALAASEAKLATAKNDALEEAAKVADGYHKVHTYTRDLMDDGNLTTHTGRAMADPLKVATAIRSLKEKT